MSKDAKIHSTIDAWESGALGESESHAIVVSPEKTQEIENAIGMQMISIRLNKGLIKAFKWIAEYHGVGYQPLMRDALQRFAENEFKGITTGCVKSQKLENPQQETAPIPDKRKMAA